MRLKCLRQDNLCIQDKLIEMGKKIDADYIVMSDYPDEDPSKTIAAAEELAPKFR